MITIQPGTLAYLASFVLAFWAYRIYAKQGSGNPSFVGTVALAALSFGIGVAAG